MYETGTEDNEQRLRHSLKQRIGAAVRYAEQGRVHRSRGVCMSHESFS